MQIFVFICKCNNRKPTIISDNLAGFSQVYIIQNREITSESGHTTQPSLTSIQGAAAARVQEGQEELFHMQGQEGRL